MSKGIALKIAQAQFDTERRKNDYLRDENAKLQYAITRWARASQVVGNHRSCSCAVCEALYAVAEQIAGEVCE